MMWKNYVFWLALVSVFCFLAERAVPWRKEQRALRPQFAQDVFWLVFNGWGFGILLGWAMKMGYSVSVRPRYEIILG